MLPHAPWVPMATWVMSFLYGSQKYEFELPYLASCWTGTSANSIFLREAPGFGQACRNFGLESSARSCPGAAGTSLHLPAGTALHPLPTHPAARRRFAFSFFFFFFFVPTEHS